MIALGDPIAGPHLPHEGIVFAIVDRPGHERMVAVRWTLPPWPCDVPPTWWPESALNRSAAIAA